MHSRILVRLFLVSTLLALPSFAMMAQVYTSSGSTGSDGALAFPNAHPGDTIIFNPASFTPKLDPAGDGVFNFTTITIPAGVTVRFSGQVLSGPIYWLATGAVDIEGTLDLSGGGGNSTGALPSVRAPSIPGSGGYPGGVGNANSVSEIQKAEPGLGPQGGGVGNCGGGGGFGANLLLVPLFGGSGGGGSQAGGGGGAGGGAILIASSATITNNGTITVAGGTSGGGQAGGGSGGGIRLVAQAISGSGTIRSDAGPGSCGFNNGSVGIIRYEANNFGYTGSTVGTYSIGTPFATFVPTAKNQAPAVKVVSVAGAAVNATPTGSFTTPDVTINSSAAVPIVVQGSNVPLGTIVHLQIYSDNGPDIVVDTPALAGTLQSSTATVSVMFPSGFSRGYVTASF